MSSTRTPYPPDVSDDEWAFITSYLTVQPVDSARRRHNLREHVNALRYLVRGGIPWRMLPHDFTLCEPV